MARSHLSIPGLVPRKRPVRRGKRLLVVSTVSALGVYFFDPQEGTRRRHVARDRALSLVRRGGKQAASQVRHAEGRAAGAAHELSEKVTPDRASAEPMNDQNASERLVATRGVTAEEPVAEAEPPPDEKAVGGEGRTPAPFGSEGSAGGEAPPESRAAPGGGRASRRPTGLGRPHPSPGALSSRSWPSATASSCFRWPARADGHRAEGTRA